MMHAEDNQWGFHQEHFCLGSQCLLKFFGTVRSLSFRFIKLIGEGLQPRKQ